MRFTIERIKTAHAKVKSGADFPNYIRDIREIGVHSYETFVGDGHSEYSGENNYTQSAPAKYAPLVISGYCNREEFQRRLKAHQQGQSDYLSFCKECAMLGVDKWAVDIDGMTCTYYDKAGNEVLVEAIPGIG